VRAEISVSLTLTLALLGMKMEPKTPEDVVGSLGGSDGIEGGRRREEWIMDEGVILLQGNGRPDTFYTNK
jgi:hypothetical protein